MALLARSVDTCPNMINGSNSIGYTIKPLIWVKRDIWVADTPASILRHIGIVFEEGLYWASWDPRLPGTTDLEALKRQGQAWHNEWLEQFIHVVMPAEEKIAHSEPWEDRMGGQFTAEEIARAEHGREGW
jgi:hypothetical protein